LLHELAHVHLLQLGIEDHTEREADEVAKTLWGITIRYDAEDVQTIGPGTSPRPAHLDSRASSRKAVRSNPRLNPLSNRQKYLERAHESARENMHDEWAQAGRMEGYSDKIYENDAAPDYRSDSNYFSQVSHAFEDIPGDREPPTQVELETLRYDRPLSAAERAKGAKTKRRIEKLYNSRAESGAIRKVREEQ
jgi:hypothetical protein